MGEAWLFCNKKHPSATAANGRTTGAKEKPQFLSSGLYRRLWNFTKSAPVRVVAGFTAGGELHPALKQTTHIIPAVCEKCNRFVCKIFAFRFLPAAAERAAACHAFFTAARLPPQQIYVTINQ